MASDLIVRDILERDPLADQNPPTLQDASEPFASPSGFPLPKARWKKKADSNATNKPVSNGQHVQGKRPDSDDRSMEAASTTNDFWAAERRRIDAENKQRIADMRPEDILQEQEKLFSSLDPAIIRRLLARARIEDGGDLDCSSGGQRTDDSPASHHQECPEPIPAADAEADTNEPLSSATDAITTTTTTPTPADIGESSESHTTADKVAAPTARPDAPEERPRTTHFPAAPAPPELDPSHPDFLAALHAKYFPNLPADPSKLAWMAPLPTEGSPADQESPYYPGRSTLAVSDLRFDFRGALIPPRLARAIPTSRGLHHHGLAPEAAGYTVRELALLARSVVPAQRCIAFQTLGRILFRLGQGEWGTDPDDEIAAGIWSEMREGRVLDSLSEAALVEHGHRGSKAYATEALWLYEKGGWKSKGDA